MDMNYWDSFDCEINCEELLEKYEEAFYEENPINPNDSFCEDFPLINEEDIPF